MATNTLTDSDCKKAASEGKLKKLFDGYGMYLAILPSGTKSWRMAYRDECGKQQTHVIGPYPLITLADARKRRDDVRLKLIDGVSLKLKDKEAITLSTAVTSYWNTRKDVGEDYKNHALSASEMYIERFIGKKPINSITREQLLELLMKMDNAGKHVYVKKVRMWVSQVFEWAIQHRHCETNPAATINPKIAFGHKPVEGLAFLPLTEVHTFMDRMGMEGDIQSVLACKLLALTWVRTKELRQMRWDQIEMNKGGSLWRIPDEEMKGKREHLVPLSTQALEILGELKMRCRGSEYVLPSNRDIHRPISENEVTALIHRIGYKDKMTGHGCRKIGSTWANENEYNRDHIEMQLAHSDGSVRGIYNSAEYLTQRRVMLQSYADWLYKTNPVAVEGTQPPPNSTP